jgi:hypothetical protein
MALVMPPVDQTAVARRGAIVAALCAVLPADRVVADEVGPRAFECDALTMYRELSVRDVVDAFEGHATLVGASHEERLSADY